MKLNIQILGTGCPKCINLADQTKKAADTLGIDYELTKITDIMQITKMGVMMTPALAINGSVKVAGKIPSVEEIKNIIKQEMEGK